MQAPDVSASGLDAELALIREAAREAGAMAMGYFGRDPQVWMKPGESPVTAADFAVDAFLKETLLKARPDYGWLSEETADSPDRLGARRTFVVDPIDGTRAFIEGKKTWCVSIAVVEEGRTIAGVLDCPALDEIYEAHAHTPALRNGRSVAVRTVGAGLPVVAGPQAMIRLIPEHVRHKPFPRYVPSLAYRLAMVAAGALDGTFVRANSHDWDLAAADLILTRAGGTLVQPDGTRPLYAGAQPKRGLLAAGSGKLLGELEAVIATMEG